VNAAEAWVPCVVLQAFLEKYLPPPKITLPNVRSHLPKENAAALLRAKGLDALWTGDTETAISFFGQLLESLPSRYHYIPHTYLIFHS